MSVPTVPLKPSTIRVYVPAGALLNASEFKPCALMLSPTGWAVQTVVSCTRCRSRLMFVSLTLMLLLLKVVNLNTCSRPLWSKPQPE